MWILQDILLILHFLGLASLLGGVIVQIKSSPRVINRPILDGAYLQLITGILLVGVIEMAKEETLNYAIVGTKLLVLIIITVLAFVNRKAESITTGVWAAIGLLTVLNIVIAIVPGVVQGG